MPIPDLTPDSQGNLSMVWVLHMTKFITREDDYWKKSGRARIWMLIFIQVITNSAVWGRGETLRASWIPRVPSSQRDPRTSCECELIVMEWIIKQAFWLSAASSLIGSLFHACPHAPCFSPHMGNTCPSLEAERMRARGLVPPGLEVGMSSF